MIAKNADELRRAVERIVMAVGTAPEGAKEVADHLVGSHLAGHDSHGIQHLPRYIEEVRAGEIDASARPEVVSETQVTTLVRGHWSWGHVTAAFATQAAIVKARENGIALVGAVEANHIGRLGHYVERAAAQQVVLMLFVGGNGVLKPRAATYGGSKAVLAPNPIAIGFPVAEGSPVVVDFATTRVAGGKLALAKSKGQSIPLGWLIDKHGNPSADPNDWYDDGVLLPFGEHKGSAIMVATEILGRILSGADAYCDATRSIYFQHMGISLVAIHSGVFSPAEQFAARTTDLVHRIRAVPPAAGFEKVLAPGDYEEQSRQSHSDGIIQIPESTWGEVVATAESLGVQL